MEEYKQKPDEKEREMKKIIVITMLFMFAAGFAYAANNSLTQKSGDQTISIQFEKGTPIVGDNPVAVSVKDAAGKEISNAIVSIQYFMTEKVAPTRKGVEMPAMYTTADTTREGSIYRGKINFSMPGSWHILVKTSYDGKANSAAFFVTVK